MSFFRRTAKYVVVFLATFSAWIFCVLTALQVPPAFPQAPKARAVFIFATQGAFHGLWLIPALGLIATILLVFRCVRAGYGVAATAFLWGFLTSLIRLGVYPL
jgi:hypothetical protein